MPEHSRRSNTNHNFYLLCLTIVCLKNHNICRPMRSISMFDKLPKWKYSATEKCHAFRLHHARPSKFSINTDSVSYETLATGQVVSRFAMAFALVFEFFPRSICDRQTTASSSMVHPNFQLSSMT